MTPTASASRANVWRLTADLIKPPSDKWTPEPHQVPPAGRWFLWILLGGRGSGKTAASARHLHEHVHGPPCIPDVPGGHWPGIIAPTLGDGVTSCALGPSGLRVHDPKLKVSVTPGGTVVRWSNGVEGKIFGAHTPEDVERLRSGGNRCIVWAEELAAWRYLEECWEHMRYGLRLGPWPHVVASTTPKPRPLIKQIAKDGDNPDNTKVVLTRATTNDNPHLAAHIRQGLYDDYGGTRTGLQELEAMILDDVPGALWTVAGIELDRLTFESMPDRFDSIAVGVDPPATTKAECGIVVVGRVDRWRRQGISRPDLAHGFVLQDYSRHATPEQWGSTVVRAYQDWMANAVVGEVNNGGDMVRSTVHNVDPGIPFREVHATRGKAKRAEPVAGMYEQHRIHHVGIHPHLEDQQTTWDPDDPDLFSPDRMDAVVWGLHHLLIGRVPARKSNTRDTRLRGRR